MSSTSTGPLNGVKILDLSTVVLGPYATQLLGDMGADVIKVENGAGDIMRHAGPSPAPGMGAIYMGCNRNKRAILLDLKTPDGIEALKRLVKQSDVFFTNVRMDGLKRLGLGYDELKKIREDLIYVHCAGYGAGGKQEGRPAYDDLIQAGSGIADLFHVRDGGPPRYMPALMADKVSGLHAAYAVIAGLFARATKGQGQFIEAPMLEAFTAFNMVENLYGHTFIPPMAQMAYTRSSSPNRMPYPTKDGYIGIMPYSDIQWKTFFELGGRPEIMTTDPRFSTYNARTANIGALYQLVGEVAATKTTNEWLALLEEADIPAARCATLPEVLEDEHLRGTGFIHERQHPAGFPYIAFEHPVKFAGTPADIRREPPLLGEHTVEVLRELGYSDADAERIATAARKP
ncbi:MAG TPA: CoA transferase [Hyphomonadaceae bacterium]|nr:CoA transferase [Hyphomonadaceae bacterium]HPI47857.1 CoA transferase [Hyphomonadaceae bacterium]